MSLDVYLLDGEERIEPCEHCGGTGNVNHGRDCVYEANITHNLTTMAEAAGVYQALWRPEEIGVTKAGQLVTLLRDGLNRLIVDQERFEELNPKNGWGTYEGLVAFVSRYLEACEANPEAAISVSR